MSDNCQVLFLCLFILQHNFVKDKTTLNNLRINSICIHSYNQSKMKKVILVFAFLYTPTLSLWAQTDKEVSLSEVNIIASKIIQKVDGKNIIPSDAQRKSSTNGYNILNKLSLPDIRIDENTHTITSLTNRGGIQLRINGVIASKADMLALNPMLIKHINFIDNPGVRFGEGIAYVIDIRTKKADIGYTTGLETSNAITCRMGSNTIYNKINWAKSELGITYNFDYRDFDGTRYYEEANYLLNDNSHYIISRNDISSRKRHFNNNIELKYNMADSASYVFQAKFSTSFNHTLNNDEDIMVNVPFGTSLTKSRNHDKSTSPVLDFYFYHTLGQRQSITANLVGTQIATNTYSYQNEKDDYEYLVDGNTSSLMGEVIYENHLKQFTISLGSQWNWKYTSNNYSGAVNSINNMHNSSMYFFGEIKGRLNNILSFMAGIGTSNQQYRQGTDKFNFWLFRPKVTIKWTISQPLQLRYNFEISQHISQIAMISNTQIRINSMEWKIGNPNIKPTCRYTHDITLNYCIPRISINFSSEYRHNRHPNMALWSRTTDNQFLSSQSNQHAIDMLFGETYFIYDIIPDILKISANGGIFRFINLGNEYSHYYTSYTYGADIQAYLGNWTIMVQADNGWRWMEGENKNRNGSNLDLSISYQWHNCNISLICSKPFTKTPRLYQSQLIDRYVSKSICTNSQNAGNMIMLNISWNIHKGKLFKKINKRINKEDKQTGILN